MSDVRFYSLNDSQDSMRLQQVFALNKPVSQIPVCFTTPENLDFSVMKKAINIEISRNDALRIRFKKSEGKWKQYFLSQIEEIDVPVYDFSEKNEEYQAQFLKKHASRVLKFKRGDIFEFFCFKGFDGQCGLFINVSHIIMDGSAVIALVYDLINVYQALVNNDELPKPLMSFEKILESDEKIQSDPKKAARDEKFYRELFSKNGEPIYMGVQDREFMKKRRKHNKSKNHRAEQVLDFFHCKSNILCITESKSMLNQINELACKYNLPPQSIVEGAVRTYLSKNNECGKDVTLFIMYSARSPRERNSGGCKMVTVPMRTIVEETDTFADAVRQISNMHFNLYKHCCSQSLWQGLYSKAYNLPPMYDYYPLVFNWMVADYDTPFPCELTRICSGHLACECYAYVLPDLKNGGMVFNYEYQIDKMTEAHVTALHQGIVKILKHVFEDPDVTVGKLLHEVL